MQINNLTGGGRTHLRFCTHAYFWHSFALVLTTVKNHRSKWGLQSFCTPAFGRAKSRMRQNMTSS